MDEAAYRAHPHAHRHRHRRERAGRNRRLHPGGDCRRAQRSARCSSVKWRWTTLLAQSWPHKLYDGARLILNKGHRLDDGDIARLRGLGITRLTVTRLGAADLHEDAAARRIGQAVCGENLRMRAPRRRQSQYHRLRPRHHAY